MKQKLQDLNTYLNFEPFHMDFYFTAMTSFILGLTSNPAE